MNDPNLINLLVEISKETCTVTSLILILIVLQALSLIAFSVAKIQERSTQ